MTKCLRSLLVYSVLLLIVSSGCETETTVSYYLNNLSSSEIKVEGSNIIYATTINQIISPNEKKDIGAWSKFGSQTTFFEPITLFGDDLVITNVAGDTLVKEYRKLSNWTTEITETRFEAAHEYTLVITDADF